VSLLAGLVSLPIALGIAVFRRTRGSAIHVLPSALLAALVFGAIHLHLELRSNGVRRAARRAEAILGAIDRHEAREGQPPSALEDLVPFDIEEIPGTGMAGYASYRYYGPDGDFPCGERLFERYELRVDTAKILQPGCFVYWPEGSDPEYMYEGFVERVGDWASRWLPNDTAGA
jgi:hypothetical protein